MPWHWGMGVVANHGNGYQRGDQSDIIRQVDPNVPVRKVYATRGKFTRAEPVAALYSEGRVVHVDQGFREADKPALEARVRAAVEAGR